MRITSPRSQWVLRTMIHVRQKNGLIGNKAGYSATPVVCGWLGTMFEVSGAFGQEQ